MTSFMLAIFGAGVVIGSALTGIICMHLSSKEHIETLRMLDHHERWLRNQLDKLNATADGADWWKE